MNVLVHEKETNIDRLKPHSKAKKLTHRTTSYGHRPKRSEAFENRVKSINFVLTLHDLRVFELLFQQLRRKY